MDELKTVRSLARAMGIHVRYTDGLDRRVVVAPETLLRVCAVESYDYDPWGLLMPGRTLGSGTKEGFSGKEQDVETGLDYFGARYYMPALGRWAAVDPLAGKYPEWSSYNYVLNNPVVLSDPDGRQIRADLGDFNPCGAYGDVRCTDGGTFVSRLDDHKARVQMALVGLSFLPMGRAAGGIIGTASDIATGNFSIFGTAVNFLLGGKGKVAGEAADATRVAARLSDNAARGWKVGEPITNLTAKGNVPAWSTVRQRFWKNEALNNSSAYSPENLARMQGGLAPQRMNPVTGALESMELHHAPPMRDGGLFDVTPVWPGDHAAIDPFRHVGN